MAEHFLESGYKDPTAVMTGGVLEEHLRKLCGKHGVALPPKPKLDTMNAALARVRRLSGIQGRVASGTMNGKVGREIIDRLLVGRVRQRRRPDRLAGGGRRGCRRRVLRGRVDPGEGTLIEQLGSIRRATADFAHFGGDGRGR
jgi:hypothetical protein